MLGRSRSRSRSPYGHSQAHLLEHSLPVLIDTFVVENNLDQDAERMLRAIPPELQVKVLEDGPCVGTNTSAVLISRIRRVTVKNMEAGILSGDLGEHALETFITENELDSSAARALAECDLEIQRRVIAEGVVTGRNRSAILHGRIRRCMQQMGLASQGLSSSGSVARAEQARAAVLSGCNVSDVELFIHENKLDLEAERMLRKQAPELQLKLMEEGPCIGTNPSAVLITRIRRLTEQLLEHNPDVSEDMLETFIRDNELDPSAVRALREVNSDVQRRVLAEGVVTGRNKSAVLHARIRRCVQQVSQGIAFGGGGGMDRGGMGTPAPGIEEFIRRNDLDALAERELRNLSLEKQAAVLAEGEITGGNKSAILMGRIRRLNEGGGLLAIGGGGSPAPPGGMPPASTYLHAAQLSQTETLQATMLAQQQQIQQMQLQLQMHAQYANIPMQYQMYMMQQIQSQQAMSQVAPLGPPGSEGLSLGGTSQEVEAFVLANDVDASGANALREQRPEVQAKVIAEGALTGANKSAVLVSRIRRIVNAPGGASQAMSQAFLAGGGGGADDELTRFIIANSLDAGAESVLRQQTPSVQQRVLDEGAIVGGNNKSAIIISRIRRIQKDMH